MRQIILGVLCAVCFLSCASSPRVPTRDYYADALLIAEQRAEIRELKRTIEDMGESISAVSRGLESITGELESSLQRSENIEELFGEIDAFVRGLIAESQALRDIQRSVGREDAGER